MSAQSHDDINKIFQTKLTDIDSGDGYWNIPPDRVFDEAMIDVAAIANSRKRRRRRIGAIILFLVGLLACIGFINDHINNLHTRIQELEAEIKNSAFAESNHTKEVSFEEEPPSDIASIDIPLTEPENNVDNNSALPTQSINRVDNISNTVSTKMAAQSLSATEDVDIIEDASFMLNETIPHGLLSLQLIERKISAVNYASGIPALRLNSSIPAVNNQEEDNRITLAFIPTTYLSWARMDNITPGSYSLTKYGNLRSSYGAQLYASVPLSDSWSLTGGLSYSTIRNQSELNDQFEYDENNQYSNNHGLQMYASNIEVMTPLGMHENSASFDVSNFGLHDGSIVGNHTYLDQSIRIISLNTGIRKSFKLSNKLSAFAGAGMSYSLIENYCSDMQMHFYDGTEMIDELSFHSEDGSGLNKHFISLNGEFGFNLALSQDWGINLTGTYSRGMTDLTKGPGRTFMNFVGIGTGIYLKI